MAMRLHMSTTTLIECLTINRRLSTGCPSRRATIKVHELLGVSATTTDAAGCFPRISHPDSIDTRLGGAPTSLEMGRRQTVADSLPPPAVAATFASPPD